MIKFGTGGWRAIIGDDFIKSNIRLIAHAIAYLKIKDNDYSPVVVGYDNRFLSQEASEWIYEFFNDVGIDVYTYNESVPTPLVMHYVKHHNFTYGMMVTASHNPYNYNGIKIIVKGGLDAPKSLTDEIEHLIYNSEDGMYLPISKDKVGSTYLINNPYDEYIDDLSSFINVDAIKNSNLNIVFNNMNGSTINLFKTILKKFNFNDNCFNYAASADPYFSSSATNTPEPTKENVKDFIDLLKKFGSNIGLVVDGDGDRLMVLDENQKVVDMDTLLCIYYWYLHEYRHESGAVIKNCVTTMRLNKMAEYYGEKCIEVPVGFKWITKGMTDYDALIGGESSGGFTYRNHVYGKDSILAIMMLLEVLAVTNMKLCKITKLLDEKFGKVFAVSEKMKLVKTKVPFEDFVVSDAAIKTTVDGVKFSYPHGWGSIRSSGTEPIIRIMAEANDLELANGILAQMRVYINENRV